MQKSAKNRQSIDKSIKKRGPGRPSLGKTRAIVINLPGDLLARVDAIAGPGQRSAIIRAAIERALETH
jgi:hypothetical protein